MFVLPVEGSAFATAWDGGLSAIGPDVSFGGRVLGWASLRRWLEDDSAAG
jgi:hypothetical protein